MHDTNKKSVFRRREKPVRALLFCLTLIMLLEALSFVSLITNRNPDPVKNYDPWCIFQEPENTIEVVAIGNSNVRSGIIPMQMWKDHGITSYAWGEPGVDPYDAELTLKKIFKKQSPSVIILEASFFFRNTSLADNLNSMVRANISSLCPLITYHRSLTRLFSFHLSELIRSDHSATKGYFLSFHEESGKEGNTYMEENSLSEETFSPLVKKQILKIERLCRKNGAKLIIAAVPSTSDWGYERHKLTEEFCTENQLTFLDMNTSEVIQDMNLDWKKGTRDGGTHLNYTGASLVTDYLGEYLTENYHFTDLRQDEKYEQWNADCSLFYDAIKQYEKEQES